MQEKRLSLCLALCLPVQPWMPQGKAVTQQMEKDQRQAVKIIRENASYESKLSFVVWS